MKIVTKKQQEKIDKMFKKKLRFVAIETCRMTCDNFGVILNDEKLWEEVQDKAEQVFYTDDVI